MLTIKKYDRKQAIMYAQDYANKRNPQYYDYTNEGGNCTNFVSQCLYAGAPVMNYEQNGWYYISPAKTSISWANVEPLYNFLTTNKSLGVFASQSSLSMCEEGDVIQLKFKNKPIFSHCLMVTKVKAHNNNGIYVCANTRDVLNVPLSFYSFEKFRVLHILGFKDKI